MIIKRSNSNNNSIINWYLPLLPIFSQYSVLGTYSLGIAILIIFTIGNILFFEQRIVIHKNLFYLVLYISIIQIINMIRLENINFTSFNNFVNPIIICVILGTIIPRINLKRLFEAYSIIGAICMVAVSYDAINLFFFGTPAIPIAIFPVYLDELHFWNDFIGVRPSGFFTEPQAYASYMFPLLIYTLSNKKIVFSLFITISIFLSSSSLGIIVVAFIYLFVFTLSKRGGYNYLLLIPFVYGLLYVFFSLEIFDFALNKILETNFTDNIRLSRGFFIFSSFNLLNMLVGVGYDVTSFVVANQQNFPWVYEFIKYNAVHLAGYTTSFFGTFVSFGLFAGVLLVMFLYRLFKTRPEESLILLLVIIILFFTQTILFNSAFVFFFSIYLSIDYKKNKTSSYMVVKL